MARPQFRFSGVVHEAKADDVGLLHLSCIWNAGLQQTFVEGHYGPSWEVFGLHWEFQRVLGV